MCGSQTWRDLAGPGHEKTSPVSFCRSLLFAIKKKKKKKKKKKNLPAMQKKQVQSLGQEDPLEEGMTTSSGTLAWRIPWTEKPGGLQSMG